jgi:hypothetical protein
MTKIGVCLCHAHWLWYPAAEELTAKRPCSNCRTHVRWMDEE